MYFEILVNMIKLQERVLLFAIFIALIPLSRCGSFVMVTEDEAVQLEFPYPCDSNKVTIQIAHRAPFYNSAEPESLNLPFYQLNRYSVTDKNCSVQVEINPVKRGDKETYICHVYRGGAIESSFTTIMLIVNYPPGDASCTFIINGDAVGDWVPLQCMASIGSMAGEIGCYQDSKRLPPLSKFVQHGETLKQTIWVSKEYPVFCCSFILYQPTNRCECDDFVWDPTGNISHAKTIDPCSATTSGLVATLSQYPESKIEDNSQLPQLIESLNLTNKNKKKSTANTVYTTAIFWVAVTGIGIIVITYVITHLHLYVCLRKKKQRKIMVEHAIMRCKSSQEKENV